MIRSTAAGLPLLWGCAAGGDGLVVLDGRYGSFASFSPGPAGPPPEPAPCVTRATCAPAEPEPFGDPGPLSAGTVQVYVGADATRPPELPKWEHGSPAGASATGGDFPAFDLREAVVVPEVGDLVLPDPLEPGADLVLRWEAGEGDLVVLEVAADGFPDCASVTTCTFADAAGGATVDRADLPDPDSLSWATVALGRTRAAREELRGGAVVEIRATAWIIAPADSR